MRKFDLAGKKLKKDSDLAHQAKVEEVARKLAPRSISEGEFYLVRAGNARKGTGTFYTRPQLAVPTTHRTLKPLCFDADGDGKFTVPKRPEEILGLKVCDPACGSASFLVAALHYLTEALYQSLCHHCGLDDTVRYRTVTLPFGRPIGSGQREETVPFPPDDEKLGERFSDWVKARLRRHVVERCIYGVDINPLAVEFARVSLWVETLDPDLPFSFLDHKIKVGNALLGCWLDRPLDYPLAAWERNGGDDPDSKTKGARTLRIEEMLKGPKKGNRRTGDGVIRQEMRGIIEGRFLGQKNLFSDDETTTETVLTDARRDYEQLHDLPIQDPDQRERHYREHVENSETVRRLKAAMDEWCALWFWPGDEEPLHHAPTPGNFHSYETTETTAIVRCVKGEIKFFHWELEFPDVFSPHRSGFDAVLGNPPWEVMKPNSQEFFTEYDPLFRLYDKQDAETRQEALFAEDPERQSRWEDYKAHYKAMSNFVTNAASPFDVSLSTSQRENESLATAWRMRREQRVGYAGASKPFAYQGSADLNAYKMFTEVACFLLRSSGRLGFILPSGLYTDEGTQQLRELMLDAGQWEWLYGFENQKNIFPIHSNTKFAAICVDRRKMGQPIRTRFMALDLSDWEKEEPEHLLLGRETISRFSPFYNSIPEVRTDRDAQVTAAMQGDHVFRLLRPEEGWTIVYWAGFHMSGDAKHFKVASHWEGRGFRRDEFGRYKHDDGRVALPLIQGLMVGQFDPCSQGYVSGAGRSAKWDDVPASAKDFRPNYFVLESEYHAQVTKKAKKTPGIVAGGGVAFREISNARNQRTMLASVIPAFPTNNKAPVLTVNSGHLGDGLLLSALMNSICFDYLLRMRMAAQTLNKFIIEECPVPKVPSHAQGYDAICRRLILNAARLTLIHPTFAPYWLWLREQYPELASRGWKAWWAVTESQRLRLRVELEVMAARLYRVSTEDFAWILRDDPSDLKGFFRVDQALPFSQRLTGLSLAAFRAVEESRWSVESASNLTDADFFARIGVPAENLMEPRFSESDVAAAGSGWEECERLSRSLLGGDEAVARLIRTGLSCPAGEVVPDGGAGAAVEDADHAEQASGTVVRSLFGEED